MENLTTEKIIKHLETMTAIQLKDLVSAIEKAFDVTAAAVVSQGNPNVASEAAEKKQASSIYLKEVGSAKVQVIKLIKEKLNMDLMKAKKLTDECTTAPQLLKADATSDELKELEEEFKKLGAVVEIK